MKLAQEITAAGWGIDDPEYIEKNIGFQIAVRRVQSLLDERYGKSIDECLDIVNDNIIDDDKIRLPISHQFNEALKKLSLKLEAMKEK